VGHPHHAVVNEQGCQATRPTGSRSTVCRRTRQHCPRPAQQAGVTVAVFAFDVAGDLIKHIWAVRNPEKLRPWTTDSGATC
jgi:RNA polymerase sigma-70 factor (ECF subfamily)